MKKNLLFAISVFILTISGLLVFCETSETAKQDTIENQVEQQLEDDKSIADLRQ